MVNLIKRELNGWDIHQTLSGEVRLTIPIDNLNIFIQQLIKQIT
jgi:hypothetical protein